MTDQLAILPGIDPDELVAEATEAHRPIATVCLISGGHDSTVLAHRCQALYDRLVFIDTGVALPGVREFVEEFAGWLGKPLSVFETPADAYDRIVLGGEDPRTGKVKQPLGFPGPMQHTRCYVDLKERQIERMVREAKESAARTSRVLAITGVRRQESQRRRGRAPVTRRGSLVFVNPLIDWTNAQVRTYRGLHGLPESEVSALLHKSGECNCGAFAAPGERDEIRSLYGAWFRDRIEPIEREAQRRGLPCATWGSGREMLDASKRERAAGALCSDCQLRFDAS